MDKLVEVRFFKMDELDEIISIYVNIFKDLTADNIEYKKNKFKKDVKRFTKANIPGDILVAIEDEVILGFASFIKKGHWYFGPFAVKEEFRNKKIGKLLLDESLKCIKKLGGGKIRLTVQKSNELAVNLYKKFGFNISSYIMELDV